MLKNVSLFVVLFCLVVSGVSVAEMNVTIFSCDFEDGMPSEISGPGVITGTQGFSSYGFGSNFLRNGSGGPSGQSGTPSILTLSGLPAHTSVSILVDVAFLDSWDGSEGSDAPDYFNIKLDGQTIFRETVCNLSTIQTFDPSGDDIIKLPNSDIFRGNSYHDSAYEFDSYLSNIQHTSDQLTIEWFADGAGWQGIIGSSFEDETWAIDNIRVVLNDVNPVPVPGAISLGLLGMSFSGWLMRKRSM